LKSKPRVVWDTKGRENNVVGEYDSVYEIKYRDTDHNLQLTKEIFFVDFQ